MNECLDVLGIGFGPANIAFAIAVEETGSDLKVRYLERNAGPSWQSAMLLDGSDIQNHPLRDLITPRNPRSYYSFTNFLHEHGRLFQYLNLGIEYPLRKEYAKYVAWVAEQFDAHVSYGCDVIEIMSRETKRGPLFSVLCRDRRRFTARSLVVAPGRTPLIPPIFSEQLGDRIFHLTDYLPALGRYERQYGKPHRVCVLGGSQSAVELILDLSARYPDASLVGLHRGYGYALKDTSPFSDHVYFPEHVDYYFNASRESKASLDTQLRRTNYSSADGDIIQKLYLQIYEQQLDGAPRITILANQEIEAVKISPVGVTLFVSDKHKNARRTVEIDLIVLATGFRNLGQGPAGEVVPPLLTSIADHLGKDEYGDLLIERDYSLTSAKPGTLGSIYLNGLCETSHGMGDAGSFSLLSLRAAKILESLTDALRCKSHPVKHVS